MLHMAPEFIVLIQTMISKLTCITHITITLLAMIKYNSLTNNLSETYGEHDKLWPWIIKCD